MANKRKYIYGEQFAQKLPGSDQNFYFRTITGYKVDSNGKPIEGTARTDLYYAPKPGQANSRGVVWTPGTADSAVNFNQGGWVSAGVTSDGKDYLFRNYSQEDADLGRIPPGKNVGDEVLGATAQQSLSTSGGRFYEAVQNNLINLAANTQPGLAQVVSAKQANAVQQQQPAPINLDTLNLSESIQAKTVRNSYGPYYYPLDLEKNENGQDIIKFTMRDVPSVEINPNLNAEKSIKRIPSNILGSVFLPVQPMISDDNAVNWAGLQLNAIEAYAAGSALELMSTKGGIPQLIEAAGKKLGGAMEQFKLNRAALGAGANVYLAQEALGLQGLLSRTTGAVLNPNLELLFQGPQLRPFTFSFRMSPRSAPEAKSVRSIIRFFKQGMAVRETNTIFLKSPHVFDIKYMLDGSNTDHPSINKIKTCALINCSVNYTPDGSYMTFNDSLRTMTSYEITLQFSELEPIFESDYKDIADDEIGF